MRRLLADPNLYHPVPHSANTAEETLICAAIGAAFVLVVAAIASVGRPRGRAVDEEVGEPSPH